MEISINDVAELAGVSTATVSRVLSNKPHVRPETRQRVLDVIEKSGYQPSRVARSLRARRSKIIGLIISDIQNPFFTALVRAVEDLAYDNQYAVFLCNSDENIDKEKLYIDLMLAENVAGVIITPTNEIDNPSRRLIQAKIPVVSVDRRMLDLPVDTVLVDNKMATTGLVDHLIEDGHRRIAAIVGNTNITTGRERYEGYVSALQHHDIQLEKELVFFGLPKEEFGYRSARRLLELSRPPSAILAGNNLLTVGCLRAINEKSLRIPQDISIATFDDLDWSTLLKPALTVISQPTYHLGRNACDLIMKRIVDPHRERQEIILDTELRIRQSCADHPTEKKIC